MDLRLRILQMGYLRQGSVEEAPRTNLMGFGDCRSYD